MQVTVLGTGTTDGWPDPSCGCASCESARSSGDVRGPTGALVDGVLLLDPDPAHRAPHHPEVAAVLLTRADPDRFDPAFLVPQDAAVDRPLHLYGPQAVADAHERRLPDHSPVVVTALSPGEEVEVAGYRVRALAGAGGAPDRALLYDVTAPDGDRLLYAAATGPMEAADLEAVGANGPYSALLLEETFGDRTDHGDDRLDLVTFPLMVRDLRAVGAVDERTDVVAVHLSHHNPPAPQLRRRLGAYGARVVPDGTRLGTGAGRPDPARAPRRTLVTGGARSGKSREAERLLLAEPEVVYVATGIGRPDDPSWQRRVAQHRERRPDGWTTVETLDLPPLLAEPGPPLLVDCLTLWLSGVLDRLDAWAGDADAERVDKMVLAETEALARAFRDTRRQVVAVTNEVGSGIVPDTMAGGRFRDWLGRLNAVVAAESEQVLLCVSGRVVTL